MAIRHDSKRHSIPQKDGTISEYGNGQQRFTYLAVSLKIMNVTIGSRQ